MPLYLFQMLTIRLVKVGKKNAPAYRVILVERTAPPQTGKYIELLGNYNPLIKDSKSPVGKQIALKVDRIKYWLSQGVQVSDTVYNLFVSAGIIKAGKRKNIGSINKGKKKDEEASPSTAPAGGPAGGADLSAGEAGEAGGGKKEEAAKPVEEGARQDKVEPVAEQANEEERAAKKSKPVDEVKPEGSTEGGKEDK